MRPKIIGIGELLWDIFPSGMVMGGAPANFASHAKALGADAAIISRVGAMSSGSDLVERVAARGVCCEGISIDPIYPTGSVRIELGEDGQPVFTIAPGAAWDHLATTPLVLALARRADAICFGTLGQRSPRSRDTILATVAQTQAGALRVFDVNLRQDYFTAEILDSSLKLANVCKVSDGELPVVAGLLGISGNSEEQLQSLASAYGLRLVAYTRGSGGSLLCHENGAMVSHPGIRTEVMDTVGAGDSFNCAMCMGLLLDWPLEEISEMANLLAAYVCSYKGAVPILPDHIRCRFNWDGWTSCIGENAVESALVS